MVKVSSPTPSGGEDINKINNKLSKTKLTVSDKHFDKPDIDSPVLSWQQGSVVKYKFYAAYHILCEKKENNEHTWKGSGSGMLRVVVERLEEVLVWDFDVGHPLEQILSLAISQCVVYEGARSGHVRRALRYHVVVRRR